MHEGHEARKKTIHWIQCDNICQMFNRLHFVAIRIDHCYDMKTVLIIIFVSNAGKNIIFEPNGTG